MTLFTRERLLRLYPGLWRLRYGSEFSALLEESELTSRVVIDTIRSAAWEWLRWTRVGRIALAFALAAPVATVIVALNRLWPAPLSHLFPRLETWSDFWIQMLYLSSPLLIATWLAFMAKPPAKKPMFGFSLQLAILSVCVVASSWLLAPGQTADAPPDSWLRMWIGTGAFVAFFLVLIFNIEGGAVHRYLRGPVWRDER